MENTGKKSIEFLIHKIWHFEKLIGKVSVWTNSSAFFYHVFTNKRLYSCPSPSPKCRRLFTRLVRFGQVFINTTQSPHATKNLWYPRYIPRHLSQQVPLSFPYNFFRDLQRPWLYFHWLIFCRGSTIRTDCEGMANLLYFLIPRLEF